MSVFDQYLLSLQNTPTDELFNQFKRARQTPQPVPSHIQGTPVPSHSPYGSVESRPRYNFATETLEEAQQRAGRLYANDTDTRQMIKETAIMPFAETASALAGTAAGVGAVGGQLFAGVPLKDAILEYAPEYWRTNHDYKATVQGWLGDPSQLSEAISTHGVEPVINYLAPLVGGPERASEMVEGAFGILGAGGIAAMTPRPSALVKNVTKGAAVTAIAPALEAMSTDDLNKLALSAGTLAIIGKYNKAGKLIPSKEIPNLERTFSDVGSKSLMTAVPKGKVDLAPNWRKAKKLPQLLSSAGNLGLGQTERLRNANVRFDLGKDFEGMYDPETNTYHFPKKASANDVLKVLGHETFHSSADKHQVLPGTTPKAIDLEKTHGPESLGWARGKREANQDYMYRNAEGERYAEASNYLDRLYEEGVITEAEYLAELQRNPYQVTVPESAGTIYSSMPMSDQPMYPAELMGYGKEGQNKPSVPKLSQIN